jgi:DnaJ domain
MSLIYGIAAVALVWWLSKKFATANTAAMAKALKVVGGILAFGAAALMALRGRIDMAILLGGVGAWLLGWGVGRFPFMPSWMRPGAARTPGGVSRVRSATIEMELDHDTGDLDGTVLSGPLAGRRLGTLDEAALRALAAACRLSDPDGLRLLEAYLDRRFPGRREHAERDADPGEGARPQQPGAMTEEEAYQVLGLQPGAGVDEIRAAHRSLMKKLHPDQGGSTYLAARVNQAKDILLSRHR